MRRLILIGALCFVLCGTLSAQFARLGAAAPPTPDSWKDPVFIQELQLTEAQVAQIEQAIENYRRENISINTELTGRTNLLGDFMKEDPVDETKIMKQWDLVAEQRHAQEKAQFQMQIKIRKICTDRAQWAKLMPKLQQSFLPLRLLPDPNVKVPRAIVQPMPSYTDEARANRIEGIIVLQVMVRKDGTATVTKVLKGLGYGLDQSAISTIEKRWRFEPGTNYGEPVDVQANIEVRFRLY